MRHTPQHRTLHLIDIENLVGSPSPTARQARRVREHYESTYVRYGDHLVVACSHHAFISNAVAWEWPHARHRVRSGEDGADLELLSVIEEESVADRFEHVVVASGDGIFTDAVALLGQQGVSVTVISRYGSLSRSLRLASEQHLFLPDLFGSADEYLEPA